MDKETETQVCKFPRIGNNRNNSINKIGSMSGCEQEEDGKNTNNLQIQTSNWHHSSRIVRVSRASGGKDRHSKVMTSKGLRDRRVRLSVTTAIQFYDLQDRLGYDQPSKAVEWLIKAASDSISELPSLNTTFPDTPKQHNHSQNHSLSKSGCSSTSETSKGSGLSLSRSEIRVKARERARKRASKEKEKENESSIIVQAQQNHHHNVNHNASFTELLTGGIGIQLGHSHSLPVSPFSGENQSDEMQQQHHFAFMHENLNHSSSSCSQLSESEYNNLNNFRISSGLVGYNRGTLQSNSPSLLPQLQRFDGSSTSNNHLPFFIGSSSASTMDNNHHHLQFSPGFDGRLQLCYGDGSNLSDQKGKANKN